MDILFYISLFVNAVLIAGAAYFYIRQLQNSLSLKSQLSLLEGQKLQLQQQSQDLKSDLEEAQKEKEHAIAERYDSDKHRELLKKELEQMQIRMKDWESAREESIKSAKAAILEAGGQMSSKLLADHKQESEQALKQQEERTKETTNHLLSQVNNVVNNVAGLSKQVNYSKEKLETVWQALSSPGGAGYFAEIGLENTLKEFGLSNGNDFIMQYSVSNADNRRLRPDAVVFLPADAVMVIDSKASKFLLDLADFERKEPENNEKQQEILQNLKKTMREHLRALASKDYESAVHHYLQKKHHENVAAAKKVHVSRMISVMYLPNEGALEKIAIADPEFTKLCAERGIIAVGPTGLASLISFARMQIDIQRQAENQEKIIEQVQMLVDSTITALAFADKVSSSLKSAANHHAKFIKSVNSRLIPKVGQLYGLGIRSSKKQQLPNKLSYINVYSDDHDNVIDVTSADVDMGETNSNSKQKLLQTIDAGD